MAGPGDIEEEDEEEPAEVSEEWGGLGEAEPTLFHVDKRPVRAYLRDLVK